jgi:C4-dicarboxylate-specific signal transduction histidine kinase
MSYGDALYRSGNADSANFYYKHALRFGNQYPDMIPMHTSLTMTMVARLFNFQNNRDSSFYFARAALRIAKDTKLNLQILESTRLLAQIHRKYGDLDSALFYLDLATAMNDSIYGPDKLKEQQLLLLQEQRRNQEIQQTEERRRNNSLLIGSVSITTIVLVASILLFRSNKIKQRTNHALQKTLTELKSTQTQLIQSEKMASLGELTAGIAHEIQNPLNFVNNFSELNKELIDELNQNAREGKIDAIQKLASDIKENEEKIEHHGKRADAIVKSMLQHSRISSGKKGANRYQYAL